VNAQCPLDAVEPASGPVHAGALVELVRQLAYPGASQIAQFEEKTAQLRGFDVARDRERPTRRDSAAGLRTGLLDDGRGRVDAPLQAHDEWAVIVDRFVYGGKRRELPRAHICFGSQILPSLGEMRLPDMLRRQRLVEAPCPLFEPCASAQCLA